MRRMLSQRSGRVWTGTAIVAALAVGVVLGSSFASRSEAAVQPPSVNFNGNVGVWQWVVQQGQTAAFERAVRGYGQSLAARSGGGAGFTLYRSSTPGPGGTVIYFGHINSVAAGSDYQVITVLAQHFPPGPPSNGDEVRELYGAYTGSLAGSVTYDLSVVASF